MDNSCTFQVVLRIINERRADGESLQWWIVAAAVDCVSVILVFVEGSAVLHNMSQIVATVLVPFFLCHQWGHRKCTGTIWLQVNWMVNVSLKQ